MSILIRVKYEKRDEVKYVGHLDTMRTFMRCLKRTNIPVSYSKGFNPRIQISFALPLGVGVTSNSEYFDLNLEDRMNINLFIGELNSTLPDGFKVVEANYPEDQKNSLMSLVKEAVYEIKINENFDMDAVKNLFNQEKILIEKTSKDKKKTEEVDIKKGIIEFDIKDSICTFHVYAGSKGNLNPNSIIEAICKYIKSIDNVDVNRKELILK